MQIVFGSFKIVKAVVVIIILFFVNSCIFSGETSEISSPQSKLFTHTVRFKGETLALIARWYTGKQSSVAQIEKENPEITPKRILIGDRILIPQQLMITHKPLPVEFVVRNSTDSPISEARITVTVEPIASETSGAEATQEATPLPIISEIASPIADYSPVFTPPTSIDTPLTEATPTEIAPLQPTEIAQDIATISITSNPSVITIPEQIILDLQALAPTTVPTPTPILLVEPPVNVEPISIPTIEPTVSQERRRLLELLKNSAGGR